MTRTRICIVGAGRVGRLHTGNLLKRVADRADVVAICDPNLEAAQKLAGDFGVRTTFPSLREALQVAAFDGAVITTPTFTHRDEAVTALEAGISIHLEKPMAMNLSECHEITTAAGRSGAAVQLGFMRRFDQDFIDAAAMLTGGEIGTPMIIKSLTHGPGLPPAWANDIRTSNGMLAEVTSHDLDTVTWFANDEPVDIAVRVANFKGAQRGVTTPHFYDTLAATITFRSGTIAVVTGVCPADYGYDSRVEIVGTAGLLQVGTTGPVGLISVTAGTGHASSPVFPSWRSRFAEAYAREMTEFIDVIGGAPVRVGTAAGTQAVALVLAGTVSLLENRTAAVSEALTMTIPPWQVDSGDRE